MIWDSIHIHTFFQLKTSGVFGYVMWFTLVCWPSAQTLEHGMRELKWFIEAKPGSNQKPGIPIAGVNNGPQELLQAAFRNLKSPTGRIELTLRCFRVWHLGHVAFWSARNKIGCNNRYFTVICWSSMNDLQCLSRSMQFHGWVGWGVFFVVASSGF